MQRAARAEVLAQLPRAAHLAVPELVSFGVSPGLVKIGEWLTYFFGIYSFCKSVDSIC